MAKQFILVCTIFIFLFGCQSTGNTKKVLPQYIFKHDQNYLTSIDQAQTKALGENKLLMLVLGAEWCHDSTGLAKKFSTLKMQNILTERFEVLFIDVDFFEDRHDIAQKFGYPAYFGTPTVMVIEPKTSSLLNLLSIPKWQNADSIPLNEYVHYFKTVGLDARQPQSNNLRLSLQFDLFTQKQVERLKNGFDYLRPIWKEVRTEKNKDGTQLQIVAEEVWQFRVQLQKDIHSLYEQMNQKDRTELELPVYDKFSWEL
jgi:thiol-disulfide isomerase/thioredoxin